MENPGIEYTDRQRWFALTKINTLSALSQIVQIGTVTPLLSLSLEQQGVEPARIGVIVSASWLAILLFYKWVPRLLAHLGLVKTNFLSAALTIAALVGMTLTTHLVLIFSLNFLAGDWLDPALDCLRYVDRRRCVERRGRAIGVHETLMGLGIAVGPLLLVVFGVGGAARPIPMRFC